MSDNLDKFEAELSAMSPRALPEHLLDRINATLAARSVSPWPDRFLLSAIGSGVLAACVIVGLLLAPADSSKMSAPSIKSSISVAVTADSPLAFARINASQPDSSWADALR